MSIMTTRPALLLVAAGLIVSVSRVASGQASVTVPANGDARVIAAIQLTKTADLSFGDLVPGATAGTVRISTAGARSKTGGVTLAAGTVSQATFTVQGQRNVSYTITVGSLVTAPTSPNTLPNSGTRNLRIGATLSVLSNQPPGTYSNTFNVTVA